MNYRVSSEREDEPQIETVMGTFTLYRQPNLLFDLTTAQAQALEAMEGVSVRALSSQ